MSSRPCFSTMPPGTLATAASSVTSSAMASPLPPSATMASAVAFALSPRAAQTTSAPCSPRRAAMAFPMPRDAPVTRATLLARLNMNGVEGGQILRTAEAQYVRVLVDLLYEPAQDRAGTYLNIRCDALFRKALHDGLPADGRRHLRDERVDCTLCVALRLRVDVGDNRNARLAGCERAQFEIGRASCRERV